MDQNLILGLIFNLENQAEQLSARLARATDAELPAIHREAEFLLAVVKSLSERFDEAAARLTID